MARQTVSKVMMALTAEPHEWPKWVRRAYLCIWPLGFVIRFAAIVAIGAVAAIVCSVLLVVEDARAIWNGSERRRL